MRAAENAASGKFKTADLKTVLMAPDAHHKSEQPDQPVDKEAITRFVVRKAIQPPTAVRCRGSWQMNITEETEPAPDVVAVIDRGLDAYNDSRVGNDSQKPLWLIARDEAGTVRAGLRAVTFFNWCFVYWLWVDEPNRGKGLGGSLLQRAETIAHNRRCAGVYLDTFTFQAPQFYLKRGYEEFGRIDNIPHGHSRIWLKKMLAPQE
jgi:GNAT superfamily N-acetyltransferase